MAVRKTGSKTAESENEKQKPVDEMNSDLRDARNTIRELLLTGESQQAEAWYGIGCKVLEVQRDPDKYGEQGVKKLIQKLRRGKDFFYDCANVAKTWSKPDFDALRGREGKDRMHLTFSHFVELLQEKDEDREARINEVLDEGLSVRVMRERIKARQRGGEQQEQAHRQVLAKMKKRWQKLLKEMGEELGGLESRGILESEVDLLKDLIELLREASARCMHAAEQQEAARKPAPEKPAVAAQPGDTKHELHSAEKVPSSPELPRDLRDVPKIGGSAEPKIEAPATEIQGD